MSVKVTWKITPFPSMLLWFSYNWRMLCVAYENVSCSFASSDDDVELKKRDIFAHEKNEKISFLHYSVLKGENEKKISRFFFVFRGILISHIAETKSANLLWRWAWAMWKVFASEFKGVKNWIWVEQKKWKWIESTQRKHNWMEKRKSSIWD